MIYVLLPSRDEAETVGLVLWKIRRVFEELGREYHVLVLDDGSKDYSTDVLEQYASVVPLTLMRHERPLGYRATVEAWLREALAMSDRPRRDCAILMHADFAHGPEFLADFVRRMDSGADIVVGQSRVPAALPSGYRWARRWGAFVLRRSVKLSQVADPTSGFIGFRLAALKPVFEQPEAALTTEGWAANAALLGLASVHARRIETVPFAERHDLKSRASRIDPWTEIKAMWGSGKSVRHAIAAHEASPRVVKRRAKDAKEKEGVV
jgi:hypothetical protein